MANTPEQLAKARKNAIGKTGRKEGSKNKKTILIEQARAKFEEEMLEDWRKLNKLSKKEAMKPENRQERQYIQDQIMGKPMDRKKIEADIEFIIDD